MAISDRITAMQEHLRDDYNVLNLAGADLTNVDKNIVNLKTTWQERLLYFMNNGTDVVWNNWDKVTGEGESISLNNTLEGKMKINLKGNTYQNSTTGKNLYDDIYSDYTRPLDYLIHPITLEQGQKYTLKATLKGTKISGIVVGIVPLGEKYQDFSTRMYIAINSGGNVEASRTITIDESWPSPKLVVYCPPSTLQTTFEDIFENYEIQLEKGSAATSYEPYTNGASPNPDYPQDIHVVSGDNSIDVCGKNLFEPFQNGSITGQQEATTSIATLKQAFNYTRALTFSNGEITGYPKVGNGSYYIWSLVFNNLKPNTRYSIACDYEYTNLTGTTGNLITLNQIILAPSGQTSASGKVVGGFTTNESGSYSMGNFINTAMVCCNENTFMKLSNIMLVEGQYTSTTIPDYEAYKGASYPISLGDMCKDFILGYVDIDGTIHSSTIWITTKDYITIEPNTSYTFKANSPSTRCLIGEYDTNKTFISPRQEIVLGNTYTTTNNAKYIKFSIYDGSTNIEMYKTGTTPIELCKIGTYQDKIDKSSGKNLFDKDSQDILENVRIGTDGGNNADSGYFISEFIEVTPNTKYTKNTTADAFHRFAFYTNKSTNSFISKSEDNTITTPSNAKYLRLCGLITEKGSIMLNEGSTALPYEPYGIGWYLNKQIGKVVLNGSENWNKRTATGNSYGGVYIQDCSAVWGTQSSYTNYFSYNVENAYNGTANGYGIDGNGQVMIGYPNMTTLADFKTWLGTHNLIVYYRLKTPTYTEITDSTLLSQLNALAKSYEGQTNISQENNDLASLLNATALREM